MTKRTKIFTLGLMAFTTMSLSACSSTVSEEACQVGNWEAQGFEDGSKGRTPDQLNKIVDACTKYGFSVDNQAWLKGYEAGLPRYCTYERGYERGESGTAYNQVCGGELAEGYSQGYDKGVQRYRILRQYAQLVDDYQYKRQRLEQYRQQLRKPDLSDRVRRTIERNIRGLEYKVDDARYRIREFERRYNIGRSSIDGYRNRDYRDRDYRNNRF